MYEENLEDGSKIPRAKVADELSPDRGELPERVVEDSDFVTQREEKDLSRGLHQRHISLIGPSLTLVHEHIIGMLT